MEQESHICTRAYQQELLEESLRRNIIIALDTGSGKTHIAVLRLKHEAEREPNKVSWFIAPTVALVEQQSEVIKNAIPVPVGQVSGSSEPNQWKDASLWRRILSTYRIMVTTPQVLLDALHHGYIDMGRDIGLLVFDEAHHAIGRHPYNMIMKNHYFDLPTRMKQVNAADTRVQPMVLGLTASPTYGSNVNMAFRDLERNLDATIRSSRHNRDELARHVFRPEFKHVLYPSPIHHWDCIPSVNYQSLQAVISTLKIEDDPQVISLRSRLAKLAPGTDDWRRVDQQLSKAIDKQDTFTHKGLRDFARTAEEICIELGTWAADWYVAQVIDRARSAASAYSSIMTGWQEKEKNYLSDILSRVKVTEPSSDTEAIIAELTPKVRTLIDTLKAEHAIFRSMDEDYSGLVFVTRRDTVLVLAELLRRVPATSQLFNVGCLLGSSSSFKRHAFLDITRTLLEESQSDTLRDFRIGDKNLIISTSVAEEGIDIQACGSVIRFDVPPNIVSWAQSRGRARKKRSSFVIMFEESDPQHLVQKWEETERQMMAAYNDPRRDIVTVEEREDEEMDGYVEMEIASTGALLTLHSAIPHLNHFCAVIPSGGPDSHVPVYELDPPDYVEGWHSLEYRSGNEVYAGPWGATVTLPRALPPHLRKFTTERVHPSKRRAQQHVAYKAYIQLFNAGLLNNHLLPLSSAIEPEKKEEVDAMLAEVAKRASTAAVTVQVDPWAAVEDESSWYAHELAIEGMPSLRMFTRNPLPPFVKGDYPTLYVPGRGNLAIAISAPSRARASKDDVRRAREWTYVTFFRLYGSRMERGKDDFPYLFLSMGSWPQQERWEERRRWQQVRISQGLATPSETPSLAIATAVGEHSSYSSDFHMVRGTHKYDKPLRLLGWRYDPLTAEEEERFREAYEAYPDLEITYPLMIVKSLPKRRNFLIPFSELGIDSKQDTLPEEHLHLHPQYTLVELASREEIDYTLYLPSILRWLSMALSVHNMRMELFSRSPLIDVPLPLLVTATTAPAAQERFNYERLETLGDTVLKFVTSNQLYAEFPLWHEGYLSRKKDHMVANVNLAKAAVKKGLYKWIIRDRFVPRKWKPHYTSPPKSSSEEDEENQAIGQVGDSVAKKKTAEDLSTKMLADVVESLIGAAYEHGGFDLAIECIKTFGLGFNSWQRLPVRIEAMQKVEDLTELPEQLALVEQMIDYRFSRRTFLVQALTHGSYQGDSAAMSLERLEFLGDAALDMVVVDHLFHAPKKHYSPGYMHLNKQAVVNAHLLAYICLNTSLAVESALPSWSPGTGIEMVADTQHIHLWQCLLHSSHRILEDQHLTALRYAKHGPEIAHALAHDAVYPWAALTSLQAPKFLSDVVESLLGAVYVDSSGSLDAVRSVMRRLGLMQVLERIVREDIDVLHPVSRLEIWAMKQKPQRTVDYALSNENGQIGCAVLIDGVEMAYVTAPYRTKMSEAEVRFTAAERANALVNAKEIDMDDIRVNEEHHVVFEESKTKEDVSEDIDEDE